MGEEKRDEVLQELNCIPNLEIDVDYYVKDDDDNNKIKDF